MTEFQRDVLRAIRTLQTNGHKVTTTSIARTANINPRSVASAMVHLANQGALRYDFADYSTIVILQDDPPITRKRAPAQAPSRKRRRIDFRNEKFPVLRGIQKKQSLKDISQYMGRSLSTTYNIAQMLVDRKYLAKPSHGKYRLTAKGEAVLNRARQPKTPVQISVPEPPRKRSVWSRIKSVFGVAS